MDQKAQVQAPMDRQEIQQIRKAQRLDKLLARYKGVVAIAVRNKEVRGQKTDRLCICVFVKNKLQLQQLSAEDVIPPTIACIPTDVIEGTLKWGPGKITPSAAAQSKTGVTSAMTDVLVGGLSISNQYDLEHFGTLGIVLTSNGVNTALTCAHVAVNPHKQPTIGQEVIEPASGKYPADKMGKVENYYFDQINLDAALVTIDSSRQSELWTIEGIDGEIKGWADGAVGDNVEKTGAATGHTYGRISAIDYTMVADDEEWGEITLENQITVEGQGFADDGDSGAALIQSTTNKMVGMMVATLTRKTDDGSIKHFAVFSPSADIKNIIE